MKFLFLLLLAVGSGGGIYAFLSSYNQKVSALRMDLMLSKQQILQLQNKFKTLETRSSDFTIEFLNTNDTSGIIMANTPVYLSPEKNSPTLQKVSSTIEVTILDKASINNSLWYYVSLPIDSNINSKGWVRCDDFSDIFTSSLTASETTEKSEE